MFTLEHTAAALSVRNKARYLDGYSEGHQEYIAITSEIHDVFPGHTSTTQSAGAIEYVTDAGVVQMAACGRFQHGLPYTVYLLGKNPLRELVSFGAIHGTHHYPQPFVGYIETPEGVRRQGHAERLLGIMARVSDIIFDEPLTSGPGFYINEDGFLLFDGLAKKHGLTIGDGKVTWPPSR